MIFGYAVWSAKTLLLVVVGRSHTCTHASMHTYMHVYACAHTLTYTRACARCVACDLNMIAPGPLEHTCWTQFAAQ